MKFNFALKTASLRAGLALFSTGAHANLISNGDFELGDLGFTSDYDGNNPPIEGQAEYSVVTDPSQVHALAASYGDHTSGSGFMMAVNGSANAGDVVWSQSINVLADTDYDFAAYISSWYPGAPAQLVFDIEGVQIGALVAPANTATWSLAFATWHSVAAGSITISITNDNLAFGGNDFALDDLYFGETIFSSPVPEPAAFLLLSLGLAGFGARKYRQSASKS